MTKHAEQSYDRLKEIIKKDKENISLQLLNLIKTDLYNVLRGYFDIDIKDVSLTYQIEQNGMYHFVIETWTKNIKHNSFFIGS